MTHLHNEKYTLALQAIAVRATWAICIEDLLDGPELEMFVHDMMDLYHDPNATSINILQAALLPLRDRKTALDVAWLTSRHEFGLHAEVTYDLKNRLLFLTSILRHVQGALMKPGGAAKLLCDYVETPQACAEEAS